MTARRPIDRQTSRLRIAGPDSYETCRRLSVAILRPIPDEVGAETKNEVAASNERIIRDRNCTACGARGRLFGELPDGPATSVVTLHDGTCPTLPANRGGAR